MGQDDLTRCDLCGTHMNGRFDAGVGRFQFKMWFGEDPRRIDLLPLKTLRGSR